MKSLIHWLLVSSFFLPSLSFAAKDKSKYASKTCGEFILLDDVKDEEAGYACRLDDGLMDFNYKTPQGRSEIHVTHAIFEGNKDSSRVIDELILQELRKKVAAKLLPLKKIEDLPDGPETEDLKKEVKKFKEMVLDESKKPIHQIRMILSVYPDLEDEILKESPEYKTLFCKYEVWKHKKELLLKISRVSSKVVTGLALLGSLPLGVVSFFGLFSIQTFASILVAVGVVRSASGAFDLTQVLGNWDDVRAGRIAKEALVVDNRIGELLVTLQKDPKPNAEKIHALRSLRLSAKDVKDLKQVKKLKGERSRQLISSAVKIVLGAVAVKAAFSLKERFSDFETTEKAQVTNPDSHPIHGSGGNDNDGGGHVGDDGG